MVSKIRALLRRGHPDVGIGITTRSQAGPCTRRRSRLPQYLLFTALCTIVAAASTSYVSVITSNVQERLQQYQQEQETEQRTEYETFLKEHGWKSPYTPESERSISPLRFKGYEKCSTGKYLNIPWSSIVSQRNNLEEGGHETWRCEGREFRITSS